MKRLAEIKEIMKRVKRENERVMNLAQKELQNIREPGSLRIGYSHGTPQYFHYGKEPSKSGTYIKKKDEQLIRTLAKKDYNKKLYHLAAQQNEWIDQALRRIPQKELNEIYEDNSIRLSWCEPYVVSDEAYKAWWEMSEHSPKEYDADMPEIYTEKGERVRSKSEKIIADKLYMMGISYRYEYPINLNGYGTVYPDFTLLDLPKRKEIIYEHFGMMDSPEYSRKAIKKMNLYMKNGYCPGVNFMATFETMESPLDVKCLEKMLSRLSDIF